MTRFLIMFGPRGHWRLTLDVMAKDSCEVFQKHACLALEGERVEIKAFPA